MTQWDVVRVCCGFGAAGLGLGFNDFVFELAVGFSWTLLDFLSGT